jgi:hypothetical protein
VTEWSSEIIIDFYRDGQEGLLSIILQRAPEDTSPLPPPLIPLCRYCSCWWIYIV